MRKFGIKQNSIKLNLGCENKILKGFINVDIEQHEGVDLVYDLNKLPLPFKKQIL